MLQMNTPARANQCRSQQTPHGLGVCIWMHLVNGTGNSPSLRQATPGVVKQDKSSRGSVDTTKARSDPQTVRMCKGERPRGAAKASCHPPPPPPGASECQLAPRARTGSARPRGWGRCQSPIHQGSTDTAKHPPPPKAPGTVHTQVTHPTNTTPTGTMPGHAAHR